VADYIPLHRAYIAGRELEYLAQAIENRRLSGGGGFTARCERQLEQASGAPRAMLTPSCTAALEMAAILLDIGAGDEIIMPSFTFPSTANAFALRGAVPVFVDIRRDTLNIDETLIEAAITPRTRALCVVHYAGVACNMDAIMKLAERRGIAVIEDAAQGVGAAFRGRALGSIGALGALSFHATKSVVAGEAGALLINDRRLLGRAETIRDKGTNSAAFIRGEVDRYQWLDIGSSFVTNELTAAFLLAQIEQRQKIAAARRTIWAHYQDAFAAWERQGVLRRPTLPDGAEPNWELYYILLPDAAARDAVLQAARRQGIGATFHYQPLHLSPAGRRFGRASGSLAATESAAQRLLRLPIWVGLEPATIDRIVEVIAGAAAAQQLHVRAG